MNQLIIFCTVGLVVSAAIAVVSDPKPELVWIRHVYMALLAIGLMVGLFVKWKRRHDV